MKLILGLIKESKWQYLIATITAVLSGASAALTIKHIHSAMKNDIPDVQIYILTFVGLVLGAAGLGLLGNYLLTSLNEKNLQELRATLSKKIMEASYGAIYKNADRIVPVITSDIATITKTASKIPGLMMNATIVLGCLAYMFSLSWKMSLITVGIFGINFFLNLIVLPLTRKSDEGVISLRNKLFGYLRGLLLGLKELNLKKDLRESYSSMLIIPNLEEQRRLKVKNNLIKNSFSRIEYILIMSALCGILVFSKNSDVFEGSTMIDFLAISLFMMSPISQITTFGRVINGTRIALKQIDTLGVELSTKQRPESEELIFDNWSEHDSILSFENLLFEYDKEEDDDEMAFNLGPIDLTIMKGETVFVIGGNGSGKTTFIKLISGLYLPTSGACVYKGNEIEAKNLENYQDQISTIFTDSHLFKFLFHIEENHLQTHGEEYLSELEMADKVRIKNRSFSKVKFSYGQQKRLLLVTSLLENKEIYVFDEWAAHQDPHFKNVFYSTILPKLKSAGKTIFVISHDDTYFRSGDRVITFQEGRIVKNEMVDD